jgi:hypothetical protein
LLIVDSTALSTCFSYRDFCATVSAEISSYRNWCSFGY